MSHARSLLHEILQAAVTETSHTKTHTAFFSPFCSLRDRTPPRKWAAADDCREGDRADGSSSS